MSERKFNDTGNEFVNVITTLHMLVQEKQTELELRQIYDYDCMLIGNLPALCIAFEAGAPKAMSLGRDCSKLDITAHLYMYMSALDLGGNHMQHIGRLCDLTKHCWANGSLYGLCHSEPMTVALAELTGRRIQSGVYLTGHIELLVPVRFCGRKGI